MEERPIAFFHYSPAAVHELDIKFDGSTCPKVFLQRLEEVATSRGISDSQLFRSAVELFTDDALFWFRGIRSEVDSWTELKQVLLAEYLPADYDYRLLREIRSRTQGPDESITHYLSLMKEYFSRLNTPLSDSEQLDIVTHNIRPFYTTQLALFPIQTWAVLKDGCLLLEEARQRASLFVEPPRDCGQLLAPDLACRSPELIPKAAAILDHPHLFCVRCRVNGHTLSECLAPRRVICYRCGQRGYTADNCPKCRLGADNTRTTTRQRKAGAVSVGRSVSYPTKFYFRTHRRVQGSDVGPTQTNTIPNTIPNTYTYTTPFLLDQEREIILPASEPALVKPVVASEPKFILNKTSVVLEQDLRPFLPVSIHGEEFSGLLDSGSEISIIGGSNCKYFSTLCTPQRSTDVEEVVTANGSVSPVTGHVLLPVTVGESTAVVKFYIIPSVSTPLLLGINFWRAFGIAPDVLALLDTRRSVVAAVGHPHPPPVEAAQCLPAHRMLLIREVLSFLSSNARINFILPYVRLVLDGP